MAKILYVPLKLKSLSSFEITTPFGQTVPLKNDMPGLAGVLLAFDTPEQAAEWGDGEYVVIRTKEAKSGA